MFSDRVMAKLSSCDEVINKNDAVIDQNATVYQLIRENDYEMIN